MTEQHDSALNPGPILQLGLSFWASKALLSAVELDVFTTLGSGELEYAALRDRLGLQERGARDFFDALVAVGMLEREGETYVNTAATGMFLDRTKPSYVGGLLEMANARLYPFWGSLTEALRTGEPQNEAKTGQNFFAVLYNEPDRLKQFAAAMTGVSLGSVMAIAAKFPWQQYKTFVDVGTAQGGLPVHLALQQPQLTGIGTDLAALEPIFNEFVAGFGLSDRLRFQVNDFMTEPLPEADVIVMGHILHDWGLQEKQMLLRKAYEAVRPGGAVIVYDAVIDDERRHNVMGLLMSLNMLIETPEGFDYTGAECQEWLREAGFSDTYVEPLVGGESMVVGKKT